MNSNPLFCLRFALIFTLAIFSREAIASDFQAKVIHITDADTITVLDKNNRQIEIRLNGIDCPEKAQAYGNKAKQVTNDLVHGERVTIQSFGLDKYGRTIADVILVDGRNLNQELVKAGYAWWYFKYSEDEQLGILEVKAKVAKVGLWADKDPVPPWIFRHRNKLATLPSDQLTEAPVRLITPSAPSAPKTSLPILGNRRSHKYHRPDCPSYDAISHKNRVPFGSAQQARDAGYELAGNCP